MLQAELDLLRELLPDARIDVRRGFFSSPLMESCEGGGDRQSFQVQGAKGGVYHQLGFRWGFGPGLQNQTPARV